MTFPVGGARLLNPPRRIRKNAFHRKGKTMSKGNKATGQKKVDAVKDAAKAQSENPVGNDTTQENPAVGEGVDEQAQTETQDAAAQAPAEGDAEDPLHAQQLRNAEGRNENEKTLEQAKLEGADVIEDGKGGGKIVGEPEDQLADIIDELVSFEAPLHGALQNKPNVQASWSSVFERAKKARDAYRAKKAKA